MEKVIEVQIVLATTYYGISMILKTEENPKGYFKGGHTYQSTNKIINAAIKGTLYICEETQELTYEYL